MMERRVRPLGEALGVKTFVPCRGDRRRPPWTSRVLRCRSEAFGEPDRLPGPRHRLFRQATSMKGSFVENTTKRQLRSSPWTCQRLVVRRRQHAAPRRADAATASSMLITLTYLGSRARDPELQRHGRGQGGAGGRDALHRPRPRAEGRPRQRHQRRAPSAPCPSPASRGGRSMIGQGRAWSPLREDTAPEGVAGCALWLLSPTSAARPPARWCMWTRASTSSACRMRSRPRRGIVMLQAQPPPIIALTAAVPYDRSDVNLIAVIAHGPAAELDRLEREGGNRAGFVAKHANGPAADRADGDASARPTGPPLEASSVPHRAR